MKEWFKQVAKGISYGLIGSSFGLLILYMALKNYNIFGNVADWVSGVGSLVAIIFVYEQIKESQKQSETQIMESRKQLDEQLNAEKERGFQKERPLFKILNMSNVSMQNIVDELDKFVNFVHSDTTIANFLNNQNGIPYTEEKYHYFVLKNISDKRMLGVRVLFNYENCLSKEEHTHYFHIDTIRGDERLILLDEWLFDGSENKLNRIEVAFNTNMRELLNNVFDVNEIDTPIYNPSISYIENKLGKNSDDKIPKGYNLDNFKESDKTKLN